MLTTVVTSTREYARPWVFPSLGFLSGRVVCLLNATDTRPLPVNAERRPYDTPGVLYQDGRFLEAIPCVADDDVVVLADADGVFQRDYSAEELDTLSGLGGWVALGYNARPGQRGAEEHKMLRPRQPLTETARLLGVSPELLAGCWVYNTGLMAATVATWRELRDCFALSFPAVDGSRLFGLHSWPQLLLCYLFGLHGFPVTELGYETHSHGHLPLTQKHTIARRQLYYDGKLVLFAHNCAGVTHG